MTETTGLGEKLQRLRKPRRKTVLLAGLALAALGTAAGIYQHYLAATRIAFVNFRGVQLARLERARGDQAIRIEPLALDALDRAAAYPVVIVHGRGLELNEAHIEQLREAGRRGAHLYVRGATNPEHDITNLQGRQLEHVSGYFRFGGTENYARLLNFSRVELDGKSFGAHPVQPPAERAMDVLFHLDDRLTFETVAAFRAHYETQGLAKPDAPTIALLTSVPGPFNANRDHVDAVIRALEARDWNVFPVASNDRRLDFLREIEPDLVVLMPHGRLSRGRSREAIAWLRERNIPMLTALSVFEDHDDWVADQQGMAGGLLTLSVVLPELDGGVAPYAVAAQFEDESGYEIFDAIPQRLDTFCDLIERWLALKARPNRDKRVAIYYYKGPGKNAMTASNMEVVPSLLNLLRTLRGAGYTVEGLPETEEEFWKLIQARGPVLGPYARGAFEEYVAEGDPELVPAERYAEWIDEHLEPAMRDAMVARYGPAPGEYMTVRRGDDTALAVARVAFGNVVVLPQPLPGVGDDTFRLVHGHPWEPGVQALETDSAVVIRLVGRTDRRDPAHLPLHHEQRRRGDHRQAALVCRYRHAPDAAFHGRRALRGAAPPARPARQLPQCGGRPGKGGACPNHPASGGGHGPARGPGARQQGGVVGRRLLSPEQPRRDHRWGESRAGLLHAGERVLGERDRRYGGADGDRSNCLRPGPYRQREGRRQRRSVR